MMEFVVWNTVQKIMYLKFLDVGGTFLSKILITTFWQNEHQILGLNKKGILAPINVKKDHVKATICETKTDVGERQI